MSINRRLTTDLDFEEATIKKQSIRVFQNNQIVENRAKLIRFDEQTIVTQSGPHDLSYHNRAICEFYALRS